MKLGGHPGKRRLFYSLSRYFKWPAMTIDVCSTVKQCTESAKSCIRVDKCASTLILFSAKAPVIRLD